MAVHVDVPAARHGALNPYRFTDGGNVRGGVTSGIRGRILIVAHKHLFGRRPTVPQCTSLTASSFAAQSGPRVAHGRKREVYAVCPTSRLATCYCHKTHGHYQNAVGASLGASAHRRSNTRTSATRYRKGQTQRTPAEVDDGQCRRRRSRNAEAETASFQCSDPGKDGCGSAQAMGC